MRWLRREKPGALALAVVALVFFAAAVIYATVTPPHLPSFMPGHVTYHSSRHYSKRAIGCFIIGALLAFGAWQASMARRRLRKRWTEAPRRGP